MQLKHFLEKSEKSMMLIRDLFAKWQITFPESIARCEEEQLAYIAFLNDAYPGVFTNGKQNQFDENVDKYIR
jgi:hypothetical protein